jgi:hypothetical protein
MRATIIPADTFCSVDGVGYVGVDMTTVNPTVHAVQWYGTHGEVESQDPLTGKMASNDAISSLDSFELVLESYWQIRAAADAEQQAMIDEQTIIEV